MNIIIPIYKKQPLKKEKEIKINKSIQGVLI